MFSHAVEQFDNFKKTVAEFHNRLLAQNLHLTTLSTIFFLNLHSSKHNPEYYQNVK